MARRLRTSTPVRAWAALLVASVAYACTDGPAAPPSPAALEVAAGAGQQASVGSPVANAPAVRVLDGRGRGIPGVAVAFRVTAGGGSVADGSAVTDDLGVAAAGAWTLGTVPGTNVLRAEAVGMEPVALTAEAVPGPPAQLTARAGDGQVGLAGAALELAPSVLVVDAYGNPVPGVLVTFTVLAGEGSVAVGNATSGADGVASAGAWTLGGAGTQRLEARVPGTPPVAFTATARSVAGAGGFQLEARYLTPPTDRQRLAVERAVARWQRVIVGDLPDARLVRDGVCGVAGLSVDEVVDDLIVWVDFAEIDGAGKILGQAGPCFIRGGSSLPIAGILTLDGADLQAMEADGTLDDVVLHEIGHVLGVGTLWETTGLLSGAGGGDPYFTGATARGAFDVLGGAAYAGLKVPVENSGAAGTRDGHWRESVLGNELMTGYISRSGNPLSRLTVASLQDLGYAVGSGSEDGFAVVLSPMSGFQSPDAEGGRRLEEAPLPFAPVPVGPNG